ncbi:MAG: restriction endonuclease subunit S [Selenomonadaceae bacterium]|nr:restriction endonuclease subunit S [Selenomonas bovis]MDY2684795.1 restriction endonuclease subunit S [Selenomonadaceae bacterium]
MNEKKTPAIRFQGFTDDWEDHKLGDVFQEYSEKNHEELPVLTIVQGKGTVLRDESNRNLQYDKSSLSNYKMVKKDDFIVHLRSFEGGFEKANSNGIISPAYHTLHGDDTDSSFYYPFFRSKNFIECLLKPHVYGIRDGKSIDIEGMRTIDIPVPSFAEQQKIGGYLDQVDYLITLHQRKLTKLQLLKKSMLTKMFPKDGARVPEIRFQGFHKNWENLLFDDAVNISNDMVDPKAGSFDKLIHIGPGDIESHTGQLLPGIKTVSESHLISGKFRFYKGDIIYSKIRPELSKCVIAPTDGLASADAYILHCNKEMWQDFLYCILQTKHFYKYATSISMRTGMPKINREELGRYFFLAPSVKEQQLIGAFFTDLDHLISLHQRKLSKLQQIKQAMLSKLFV